MQHTPEWAPPSSLASSHAYRAPWVVAVFWCGLPLALRGARTSLLFTADVRVLLCYIVHTPEATKHQTQTTIHKHNCKLLHTVYSGVVSSPPREETAGLLSIDCTAVR